MSTANGSPPTWGVKKALGYLASPFISRGTALRSATTRAAPQSSKEVASSSHDELQEGPEAGSQRALGGLQITADLPVEGSRSEDFPNLALWRREGREQGVTNPQGIDGILEVIEAIQTAEEKWASLRHERRLQEQQEAAAATTPATTPAAFPALEPFQEALPLRSVESVQSFVDEAEDAEVKKRPSQPAPWATKPRQTPLKLLGKGRNGAEGVSTPLSTPKPFLVSGKRPVEQDLSTTRTKVSRFAAVPSGLPTTPQPIKRQPDLLFKPSAPSSSTPAFDSSPPIFPTTATAAPVGNDKTSGTPWAGRQVRFTQRPTSVIKEKPAEELQPKRPLSALRKLGGAATGLGGTKYLHQQGLPTGLRPLRQDAPRSIQEHRKKRLREVTEQAGSTPHPSKKTRQAEGGSQVVGGADDLPQSDTARLIMDSLSRMESPQTSPQAKQESRAQHEELFPPPNSFWDDDKSRPPLPLQRFRRHGIDHTPVQPERSEKLREVWEAKPDKKPAAEPAAAEKARKPAKALEPVRKRQRAERPASRYGLLSDSDSDESAQEHGNAVESLQPAEGSAAGEPKASTAEQSFKFGGERPPEQGTGLAESLKDAPLQLARPNFAFTGTGTLPQAGARESGSQFPANGQAGLPGSKAVDAAALSNEESVLAASVQLPSESEEEDKEDLPDQSIPDGLNTDPPAAKGWPASFMEQNKTASQTTNAATEAFLATSSPLKPVGPAAPSGFGSAFMAQNKAATAATDAATKAFLSGSKTGAGSQSKQPAVSWGGHSSAQNKPVTDSSNAAKEGPLSEQNPASALPSAKRPAAALEQGAAPLVQAPEARNAAAEASASKQDQPDDKASKPAASGWGDGFLQQNQAASKATDASTKAFLGNPKQGASTDKATPASAPVDHAKLAATLFGSGAQPISPQPSPVSMGSPSPAFKMPGAESPAAEKEHPSPAPFKFGQGGSLWGGSQAPKQGLFGQTNEPASADPKSSAGASSAAFSFGSNAAPAFGTQSPGPSTTALLPAPEAKTGSTSFGFTPSTAAANSAPASSPSGFPAPSTGLFGATSPGPAAASTPASFTFGAPAPSQSGAPQNFGFSAAAPSPAASTASISFGAAFGSSNAGSSGLLSGTSAPSFGSSTSSFSFGAPATNAAPQLGFGSSNANTAMAVESSTPSTGGFSFASSAPAFGQGGAGATSGFAQGNSGPGMGAPSFAFQGSGAPFGSTQGGTMGITGFGGNTAASASSQPSSVPTFGLSSQPAVGSNAQPSLGGMSQPGAYGATGAFGQQSAASNGSQPVPSFGSPNFGAPAFGANSGSAGSAPAFAFGATTPGFGGASGGFGGAGPPFGGMSMGAGQSESQAGGTAAARRKVKLKRAGRQ